MKDEEFTVPAIIFDRLPEDHVVQMFVTINAKHTRLNASHLVSLSGRQLYKDDALAAAHDVVRALNDREDSPLHGEIKLLGVGHGRVAQAPIAQELKKLFASDAFGGPRKSADFREDSKKFFVNYFKQVSVVFGAAWAGVNTASSQRPPFAHSSASHPTSCAASIRSTLIAATSAIGRVIAPWGRRIGNMRFESEGVWKKTGTTVDSLARELKLALEYPEGAGSDGKGLPQKNTGWSSRRCPILKCQPGSPQHLRRPAVNHRPTDSNGKHHAGEFLRDFASCTVYPGQQCGKDYTAVRETFACGLT